MPTRRSVLIAGVALGTLLRARHTTGGAPQPAIRVSFSVPAGACDCHAHIFGDYQRFPLLPSRNYTPGLALPAELAQLHRTLHVERSVIVTPTAYGADNSATLYGVRELGSAARAVVVIDETTPEKELDAMEQAGARGVRLFLAGPGMDAATARRQFQSAEERLRNGRWHIQIFTNLAILSALKDLVAKSAVPVVFDHFGGARGEHGISQPGFADLLELVGVGKAYVKLSAAYRFSKQAPDFDDMRPLAQALIAANPARILWATDWPHTSGDIPGKKPTDIFPFIDVDDAHLMNLLAAWVPDPTLRRRILVENPEHLYEF